MDYLEGVMSTLTEHISREQIGGNTCKCMFILAAWKWTSRRKPSEKVKSQCVGKMGVLGVFIWSIVSSGVAYQYG